MHSDASASQISMMGMTTTNQMLLGRNGVITYRNNDGTGGLEDDDIAESEVPAGRHFLNR